jgi:hypothetical protein
MSAIQEDGHEPLAPKCHAIPKALRGGIGPRAWNLLNPRTQRLVVDVSSKSEDLGVGLERRELVVADVYCLYASVGHKSAVDALQLITPLGTNPNLGSCAKTTYERLKKLLGRKCNDFEPWSLDAYLLTPLLGLPRPLILLPPKAKTVTAELAGAMGSSSSAPLAVNSPLDNVGPNTLAAPAVDPAPAIAAAAAAANAVAVAAAAEVDAFRPQHAALREANWRADADGSFEIMLAKLDDDSFWVAPPGDSTADGLFAAQLQPLRGGRPEGTQPGRCGLLPAHDFFHPPRVGDPAHDPFDYGLRRGLAARG